MSEAAFQQPQSEEASRAYQRGWDDCLMRVYQVLGEKFTLPKGLPSAADERMANKALSQVEIFDRQVHPNAKPQ
ncbi:hypothetical protein [Bradyrhizobium japonicum]|uniref:hypothetical protein n=1 Tax=Bradyrhizobium japonicum TaxID=375 RepID=UPI001BAC55A3|nr:hypothetical protein [Bradyrhizobium japonicum]MBR0913142.1 hypothetical protein [Bradyrhizobium japonicum]